MNFNSIKPHKREYFTNFLKDGTNIHAIGDYSEDKTDFVVTNETQKHMFVSNMK